MAIPKNQSYNTTPKPKPNTASLSNSSPGGQSGVGYDVKKNNGVPTQSGSSTVGQGRNTGSNTSDYQKYLNDGINQNDWRDPIADSAALNKQAQAAFEKQLKQVSDMNREAASKKGKEERQSAMMQQTSNERIAAMQNQQLYQRKGEIPQSQATLQYNANAAEKISAFASKAERSAARMHDQRTIANQFKHDRRMAMNSRGHEARMAYQNNLAQQSLTRLQNQNQSSERLNQRKLQEMQSESDLKKIGAESQARLKESQMNLAAQEKIEGKRLQSDLAKTYISGALNSLSGGNSNYGGYW